MTSFVKRVDMGGLTLVVDGLRVGATKPGQAGTELTGTEIALLDGITAGTATASKALVVDSSINIAAVNNVSMTGDLTVDGAVGTGTATPGLVKLTTPELTIVDGDELGRITFSAPLESSGTDAILVGAAIVAEADDTFTASVNDTDLVFMLGVSEAAAEKFRMSSAGYMSGGSLRSVVEDGAAVVLTQAQSGGLCVFDKTDGALFTLPSPVVGLWYDFVVDTVVSSGSAKVITSAGSIFIKGTVNAYVTGADADLAADAANGSTHVSVTMNGTTTGGIAGTKFRLTCRSATVWEIEGDIIKSGSVATSFATS